MLLLIIDVRVACTVCGFAQGERGQNITEGGRQRLMSQLACC